MAYTLTFRHKTRDIERVAAGHIAYVLNYATGSPAPGFVAKDGPCAASMGRREVDADHVFAHTDAKGAQSYQVNKLPDLPAILGFGGSLIYFINQHGGAAPPL